MDRYKFNISMLLLCALIICTHSGLYAFSLAPPGIEELNFNRTESEILKDLLDRLRSQPGEVLDVGNDMTISLRAYDEYWRWDRTTVHTITIEYKGTPQCK